jgi:hypothetical protein
MVVLRFLIVAAVMALAACSSSSLEHEVQQPGEASASGLQVPPDMWARPGQSAQQTANLPAL